MGTVNISLPNPLKAWVADQARSGRHANPSDDVRDLIGRDRLWQQAIAEGQAAVDAGHTAGPRGFEAPDARAQHARQ